MSITPEVIAGIAERHKYMQEVYGDEAICPRGQRDCATLLLALTEAQERAPFDMEAHLERQRAWSRETFGMLQRPAGVIDHIRKELLEIEADPTDLEEWVDVIILAFDGAWRAGWEPADILKAIVAKQTKNESRVWPDWRTADPDKTIEHDRTHDARAAQTLKERKDG